MDNIEMMKKAMQEAIGITDEDFQIFFNNSKKSGMAEGTPKLMKYKIIAEVTDSKYCTAGVKTGQKYVFQTLPAVLLPESNCPPCVRALGPIGNMIGEMWGKILKGDNPQQVVECLDPGVNKGGLGHVIFKIYAQKVT